MTDTQPEAEVQPEVPNLVDLLKDFEGSPGETQREEWKQQFGEIFVSGFSETELFVWRPLGREEYVKMQKKLRAPPAEGSRPVV